MITIELLGGLGNQMFQYAAAYALAKKQGAELCLNLSEFERYPLREFMLDHYSIPEDTSYSSKKGLPLKLRKFLPGFYIEPHYHYDPKFLELKGKRHIYGYFQSEKYFADYADDIREQLTLKTDLSESSVTFKDQIEQAPISVSLHMRRGDYVSDQKTQEVHGNAPEDFYRQAVKHMEDQHGEDIQCFIFSDDPDYAEGAFDFCKDKVVVRGNDNRPHEDMHLMSCCDHHILANSSFSWWGAWLNSSKDKIVIAPKHWFAPKTLLKNNIKDLFPEGWITL